MYNQSKSWKIGWYSTTNLSRENIEICGKNWLGKLDEVLTGLAALFCIISRNHGKIGWYSTRNLLLSLKALESTWRFALRGNEIRFVPDFCASLYQLCTSIILAFPVSLAAIFEKSKILYDLFNQNLFERHYSITLIAMISFLTSCEIFCVLR